MSDEQLHPWYAAEAKSRAAAEEAPVHPWEAAGRSGRVPSPESPVEPWLRAAAPEAPPTTNGNPFVASVPTTGAAPEQLEDDALVGSKLWQPGLQEPASVRTRPISPPAPEPSPRPASDSIWLVGASGGVGTSTLARLAGDGVVDAAEHEPVAGARVVIVAATHAVSLEAAAELGRQLAAGRLPWRVLGIVLVHDRDRLPEAIVRRARAVGRMFPKYLSLPFASTWRDEQPTRITSIRGRQVVGWLTKERNRA